MLRTLLPLNRELSPKNSFDGVVLRSIMWQFAGHVFEMTKMH